MGVISAVNSLVAGFQVQLFVLVAMKTSACVDVNRADIASIFATG